jgi:hypothetical protein
MRNTVTTLRRRRSRRAPMRAFDDCPPALRRWLAGALLPWSVESARRRYDAALRGARGDVAAALSALSALEAQLVAQDAVRVWGTSHPAAAQGRRA